MNAWKHKPQPPFNDHLGVKIDEWQEGRVQLSVNIQPEHCNSQNSPHGGFVCTLIDIAGALAGVYCPYPDRRRQASTLSLNTSFTGLPKTKTLKVIGQVTSRGRKMYYSTVEVSDTQGTVIATGQMVLRYRGGSETLEGLPMTPETAAD